MSLNGLAAQCWYCSDETIKGHLDAEFDSVVAWDIPMLEGYQYRFFRNFSWKASIYNGFFGLINPGMALALFREPRSVVVVHGWAYLTNILVLLAAWLAGHRVCMRGESPLNQELLKSKLNFRVKKVVLQGFLFRFIHLFLYIGTQNKLFYQHFGVRDERLVFVPYAVDNARFQHSAALLLSDKPTLRKELNLPSDARIVLFTAKYIEKKRPLDLLSAYGKLPTANTCLVMVGEGKVRPQMEEFIKAHQIQSAILKGFVNQTDIVKYYATADVFVMCSGQGETWGLSVNEAMNFGLPVVVSDLIGCAFDLVEQGENGFVIRVGDVDGLSDAIEKALQMGRVNNEVIMGRYSFDMIIRAFREIICLQTV
jgi:glycosyltransferase involved in cell wall biosynthesis